MASMVELERTLQTFFTTKLPKLPMRARHVISQNLRWLALVLAILTAWDALSLWRWAKWSSDSVDYANSLIATYGGTPIVTNRWSIWVVIALVILVAQAALFFMAFRAYSSNNDGWRNLYHATLLYAAFGLVIFLSAYADISNLIGNLLFAAIILYVLFQVRDMPIAIVEAAKRKVSSRPRKPATKG